MTVTAVGCAAAASGGGGSAGEGADGPLTEMPSIVAAVSCAAACAAGGRDRTYSVFESDSAGIAAMPLKAFSCFLNPKPQLKFISEGLYRCLKKETFDSLGHLVDFLESGRCDNWAVCKDAMMPKLFIDFINLSFDDLDRLQQFFSDNIKQLTIGNLRDLPAKVKFIKQLIDKQIYPKELLVAEPLRAIAISIDVALTHRDWEVFTALSADSDSETVIFFLERHYEAVSVDDAACAKWLENIKHVAKNLGRRYHLKGFEKTLIDWVTVYSVF